MTRYLSTPRSVLYLALAAVGVAVAVVCEIGMAVWWWGEGRR